MYDLYLVVGGGFCPGSGLSLVVGHEKRELVMVDAYNMMTTNGRALDQSFHSPAHIAKTAP
jgi:hypothetical protein